MAGKLTLSMASIALVVLLAISSGAAAYFIRDEIRAGGMEDKWVFHDHDSYGNEQMMNLLFVSSQDVIIGQEGYSSPPCLVAISPDGTILWRSPINALPCPMEGPDGGFYYVDWVDSNSGRWANITALTALGSHRWSYIVPNGTLDLWAIYPDGIVIAHNYLNEFNATTSIWETVIDRAIAISREGEQLWTLDMPFESATWRNPKILANGTFAVYAEELDGTYEFGVGKYGSPNYLQKGQFMTSYMYQSFGTYGNLYLEVRREAIDSETTVVSVYAFDSLNGSFKWKTVLGYSDNPHNLTPGGGWELDVAFVDSHGQVFCDEMDSGYSYSLDLNGTILWKKPYFGLIVDIFPSSGLLVVDDESIKRINADGSLAWRHYTKFDGYSGALVASDETVYYDYGSELHALVPATGMSMNVVLILVVVATDVVALASYGALRIMRRRIGRVV